MRRFFAGDFTRCAGKSIALVFQKVAKSTQPESLRVIMSTSISVTESLGQALKERDESSRADRVARITWLSSHISEPMAYMGRAETLHLMAEVKSVFVSGNFAATLLLSLAVIEHCLVEELQYRELVSGSPTFADALTRAEACGLLLEGWLSSLKLLSLRRNSFVHLKDETHQHGLGNRVQKDKIHPRTLLEGDAKEAISLMYKVFVATLREAI